MTEMDAPETKLEPQTSMPSKIELQYLKKITNEFSKDLILGSGGFGTVYKGEKENGIVIAVKKLNDMQGMDDKQFLNEVKLVMDISHPNIVRAEGYCYHTERELMPFNGSFVFVEKVYRLLCFEYLPHGSLDKHLSDEFSGLQWPVRYNIIHGICKGLYYLHEGRPGAPILHLDLKPANVLLDKHMIPKIADFGQSRLFGEGKTHYSTMNIVGTRGYMAPEYIDRGILTRESDIYSLGVILMEIVTGDRKHPENTTAQEFSEVKDNWRTRLQATLTKTSLEEECRQINLCIIIGLKCMERDPKKRPSIIEIIEVLGPRSIQEDGSDVEQRWEVVPLEWCEALDNVALRSPEQSIKGLEVIFHELLRIFESESTVPQYIIKDADRLVSYLSAMAEKTSRLILSGATSMSVVYFAGRFTINTLTQAFNIRDLAKAVKAGTLGTLLRYLLIWSTVNKDGELSNSIKMLLRKIQENAERISMLLVFMNLLRPLDPARWPSCATPVPLEERTHIYSELVAECLDAVAKNFPETVGEYDFDCILSSIQIYFEELGEEEIKKREETKDNGLGAVMDVLAELVHIRGPLIKDHHSMVRVDAGRQPIILAYIDSFLKENLKLLDTATVSNPSASPIQLTPLEKVLVTEPNRFDANQRKNVSVRGVLSVTIISAEDIQPQDMLGMADPYVVLYLNTGETKLKTRVVPESLNPIWNQTFDLVVKDVMHDLLLVEVWDHVTSRKDFIGRFFPKRSSKATTSTNFIGRVHRDIIGSCVLTLTRALLEGEFYDSYVLQGAKSGKLNLHIKWTPQPMYRDQ